MKLVKEDLKEGQITVIPQDSDDLYCIFNVITEQDQIIAKTSRKVKKGMSGSETTVRVLVTMKLDVHEVEFHGFGESIRVKGTIISASDESISLGSHHSITLELDRPVTIIKEKWSMTDRDSLRDAQLGQSTGLIIMSIDDESALITLVGSHASKVLLDLRPTITRKGSDPNQFKQATDDFFRTITKFLNDLEREGKMENLIIGGPGFTHEKYMDELRNNLPHLAKKTLNVAINNSGPSGISEIVTHHIPDRMVENNSAKIQADLLQQVMEHLGKNTGLVAYANDVYRAEKMGAIEHLMVLDTELHDTIEKRKKVQTLMDAVKSSRGKVTLMSSLHESGKIVDGFGKLIALLRYKIPK